MQAVISQPRIVVYGVLGWEKAMGFGMIWGCQSCYELMGGSAAKWDGPPRCSIKNHDSNHSYYHSTGSILYYM